MPLYGFKCTVCSREEDMYLSISESGSTQRCPICHSDMERTLTSPAGYSMGHNPASSPNKNNFSSIKAKK